MMSRTFFGYVWGVIRHPAATFDELAKQSSIRPAVLLTLLGLLLGWLNMLLFWLFGYDWLGTRRELLDPTYVGFFGRLQVGIENWVSIFGLLLPLLSLLGLVVMPGMVQVLSKGWRGQGSFEQMINTLVFAYEVPAIVIRSVGELLTGVPMNLISGHPYWFTAAMNGEFGPTVAAIWNFYVIGIYTIAHDLWIVALGAIAIQRVQRIPGWVAALLMLFAYLVWMYGLLGTVVR